MYEVPCSGRIRYENSRLREIVYRSSQLGTSSSPQLHTPETDLILLRVSQCATLKAPGGELSVLSGGFGPVGGAGNILPFVLGTPHR